MIIIILKLWQLLLLLLCVWFPPWPQWGSGRRRVDRMGLSVFCVSNVSCMNNRECVCACACVCVSVRVWDLCAVGQAHNNITPTTYTSERHICGYTYAPGQRHTMPNTCTRLKADFVLNKAQMNTRAHVRILVKENLTAATERTNLLW